MKGLISWVTSAQTMLAPHKPISPLEKNQYYFTRLLTIAWPSALETVLIFLISSVDLMMVGSIGTNAIAAVGITTQPRLIVLALINSLNVGVTAVVARRVGENNREGANKCIRQAVMINLSIAVIMASFGYIFAEEILLFSGADAEYLDFALDYFRPLMISVIFNSISLTINAGQRGAGRTKISLRTNLTSNIVNVVFNFLLINGIWIFPTLQVQGAGIATLIGSIIACIMSVYSLFQRDGFLSIWDKVGFKFDKSTINAITKISSSAVVEQICLRIGIFMFMKIVAGFGAEAFAAHQACSSIQEISFAFGDGISIATSALLGQSLGRKRPDEAIIYGKIGQRLAFAISSILCFVFLFGGKYLIILYDDNPNVIEMGTTVMIIIALTTHAQTSRLVMSGALRGAGDTKFVAFLAMLCVGIIRPICAFVLCGGVFDLGLNGAWIAMWLDQVIRATLGYKRFSSGKWSRIEI
ncbi:MAG: MATE family efflux transporter [Clostridia bacterium]